MAKSIGVRFDDHQIDHLREMVEHGEADSISEAVRMEVGRGDASNTGLRRLLRRTADSTTLLGVFWIGLTFVYPLQFRAFAIPIFAIALTMYLVDRGLANVEPAVSRRIYGVFRGERA